MENKEKIEKQTPIKPFDQCKSLHHNANVSKLWSIKNNKEFYDNQDGQTPIYSKTLSNNCIWTPPRFLTNINDQ